VQRLGDRLIQIRRDVCLALHGWPPSPTPSSCRGRPTSRQAHALCWNLSGVDVKA
jgi:hypothetical protein